MDELISKQKAIDLVKDVCDAIISTCECHYDHELEDLVFNDIKEVDAILKCNKEIRIALRNLKGEPERAGRWSGLWSEPDNEDAIYGEKLNEGDTIYLLGVEGTVRNECGAWGWGSCYYVPWDELNARMPHGNNPDFCYCDNFVSFWELKWNFDDGYDWDGVPFISHKADAKIEVEHERNLH